MSITAGWSAEMDQKLEEMKADPDVYFKRARERVRDKDKGPLTRRGGLIVVIRGASESKRDN